MTRLTNEMRDDMIRACVNATYKKRDEAYEKLRVAFADALYAHALGDAEKIAKKLPAGWCSSHREVLLVCEGFNGQWDRDTTRPSGKFKLSKDRLFPSSIPWTLVKKDHPFYDGAQAIATEFHAILRAKCELKDKLRGLTYACATLAKLAEAWPAGKKYFPVVEPKAMPVVPFALAAEVNAIMGLSA